jgi:hypothetical protein
VTPALREFIKKEHAIVGERHLARHRHLAAADQARVRDEVGWAAEGGGVTRAAYRR